MNAVDQRRFSNSEAKRTSDVDRLVGLRLTTFRKAKGLSQTALGTAVGVTFQQVQKYEKGQNRVGAGRLGALARFLEVPVSAFFDDDQVDDDGRTKEALDFMRTPGAVDLLRVYAAIEDDEVRREVLQIVRSASRISRAAAAEA